jgi:hypothetical protein
MSPRCRFLRDEYRLVVQPVSWPQLDGPPPLRLVDERRFASGAELRSFISRVA